MAVVTSIIAALIQIDMAQYQPAESHGRAAQMMVLRSRYAAAAQHNTSIAVPTAVNAWLPQRHKNMFWLAIYRVDGSVLVPCYDDRVTSSITHNTAKHPTENKSKDSLIGWWGLLQTIIYCKEDTSSWVSSMLMYVCAWERTNTTQSNEQIAEADFTTVTRWMVPPTKTCT